MPSPYGKGEEDPTAEPAEPDTEIRQGVTGGDTRLQVFGRLVDLDRHVGVTVKADVPDDHAVVDSWTTVFAGANWHERECHEMFGIGFKTADAIARRLGIPNDSLIRAAPKSEHVLHSMDVAMHKVSRDEYV